MAQRLHLVTNNAGLFRQPTVEVDTIRLPMAHDGMWFETAIRTNGGCDDVERYETMAQAVEGHQRWARKYQCTNEVAV